MLRCAAQEINPELRLVVAIFNTGLGERIRSFFSDCAVLSESAMAAPSFVAAALDEPAPSHVKALRLFGHKIGAAFGVLLAVLVAGFVLLATAGGYTPANALYLAIS
jgi:hypothetical protein